MILWNCFENLKCVVDSEYPAAGAGQEVKEDGI